jgi:4-carboxymuconolactone decarboxylase
MRDPSETIASPSMARQEENPMSDSERRQRGLEMINKVYAGDVVTPPPGNAFTDVMLEQLFAEVWSRDVLSIRDRRILLMGIIAEKGEPMTFGIQAKAAMKNGELEPAELRELLLMIAQYAGYPRAASLIGVIEQKIAEFEKEKASA